MVSTIIVNKILEFQLNTHLLDSRLEEHLVGGTCLARFRVVESATELGHFSCRKREYKAEQLDFTWENK
jgi:hypothetical protein